MLLNSHHAKSCLECVRVSCGRCVTLLLIACAGCGVWEGESFSITSYRNQGDATILHRIVRSQSPARVVGCVFFCACLDEISWRLGSPDVPTWAKYRHSSSA